MIIVSDATPIISFLKLNRLDILETLFREVLLPEAVYHELTINDDFKEEALAVQSAGFLRVVRVEDRNAVALLQRLSGLDLGESEAIIYSEQNKSDLLIVDETKARQVAQSMNIRITGTIGILTIANEQGILTRQEAEKCIHILRANHRHISDALLDRFLKGLK